MLNDQFICYLVYCYCIMLLLYEEFCRVFFPLVNPWGSVLLLL